MEDSRHNQRLDLGVEGVGSGSVSPIVVVHRALRGRYRVALPLAVAIAVVGGYLGYTLVEPVYQSTGLVKVSAEFPEFMKGTYLPSAARTFDSRVATQATMLESRRVLDRAIEDPRLVELGFGSSGDDLERLESSLTVLTGRGEEIIALKANSTVPERARAMVNAVLGAYYEQYLGEMEQMRLQAVETLESRRDSQIREVEQIEGEISRIVMPYGGRDLLRATYTTKFHQLREYEARLHALRSGVEDQSSSLPAISVPVSGETRDAGLETLRREELSLELRLEMLVEKTGPRHPSVVELADRLRIVRERIRQRQQGLGVNPMVEESAEGVGRQDRGLLIEGLSSARDALSAETAELGFLIGELDVLEGRLSRAQRRLDTTREELESLQSGPDGAAESLVSIAEWGSLPLFPLTDRRLATLFLGIGSGGGVVMALFVLLGLLDRRCKTLDQLDWISGGFPVIGSIPELKRGLEGDSSAANAVHELRNMLVSDRGGRGAVLMVCGSMPGDGATSVALALGTSLALAGQRTTLIDMNLSDQGLSRELGVQDALGVRDVVMSGEVATPRATSTPGLRVLPAGRDGSVGSHNISPESVSRLLGDLGSESDVLVIDAGPIVGGVVSSLVAPISSRGVLVIGRNRSREVVRQAVERARMLGSSISGVVFNRAMPDDASLGSSKGSAVSQNALRESLESLSGPVGFDNEHRSSKAA